MEEGTASTKPSLQQSAYSSASAAAEPGLHSILPHIDESTLSAGIAPANGPNHYDALAPFEDPTLPPLAETTFPAGAAYNDGIAFPNRPGHYIWVPEVAAGPMDQYVNTNSQYLDPSFSLTDPYTPGIIGNGHEGLLQTNCFSTHANAADAFSNASYAVDNGNSYKGPFQPTGFSTHTNAAAALSNASYAVNNGNSFGGQHAANGLGTQMSAAGAFSNASYAVDNGNSFGGQHAANGLGTQMSATGAFANAFNAVNDYGGQFSVTGLGTQAMTAAELPNAFDSVENVNNYGGQFAANGLGSQMTTAAGLPNAFNAINDNASPLGPAQVAPARHTCAECNRSFKRRSDLKRHAKKHQADSKVFRCVAVSCGYSSYRKDKLDDHVENCHAVAASGST